MSLTRAPTSGCTNVITHKIAVKNGVHLSAMRVRLEADFVRRGVQLAEEVDLPFPAMRLHIDITTDADDAAIERLKRELAMYCAISKLIRASGTRIEEIWSVSRP